MFTRGYVGDIIVAGIVGLALGYMIGSTLVVWKVN
jgi:hypothetical protein